ncbi:MAG: NAD(P)-dependent oxidoreductase [Desulfurococcales archaeon]|jgi:3-hydroxyisobutyrate dehydrogenase|nr:NAD(P)-dependent oxidoreductase [Desulfurococcales archaeon]
MERVGFIGLGIMGLPMATHIAKAGYPLTVYNRTRSKAEPLRSLGVYIANSPKEVAERSDIVIAMVTDGPDVEQILFREDGVVKGARPGLVFIDMGTNSPEYAKSFAERLSKYGVEFLDAPVTGGEKGAREGTLTIMVGGKYEVFKRVEPILRTMGKTIVYVGDVGSGQLMKLLNQIVVAINMVALVEAMTLARRAGVGEEKLFQILSSGAANSFTVQYYMPKIMKNDLEPGFRASHLKKDLRYALEQASRHSVPLPATALTFQLYNSLESIGLGEKGTHSLIKLYEIISGMGR